MNQQVSFDYQECFKDIYYFLYSNGNSSRAERIVSDITKVLLCKLMIEKIRQLILMIWILSRYWVC